jgi:hypothetical protein
VSVDNVCLCDLGILRVTVLQLAWSVEREGWQGEEISRCIFIRHIIVDYTYSRLADAVDTLSSRINYDVL